MQSIAIYCTEADWNYYVHLLPSYAWSYYSRRFFYCVGLREGGASVSTQSKTVLPMLYGSLSERVLHPLTRDGSLAVCLFVADSGRGVGRGRRGGGGYVIIAVGVLEKPISKITRC